MQQTILIFLGYLRRYGLTGIVLDVKFRLKRINTAYIRQRQIKARNLDEIMVFSQRIVALPIRCMD